MPFSIKYQLHIALLHLTFKLFQSSTDLHAQSECLWRKYDMKDVVVVKTRSHLQMFRPQWDQLRIVPVVDDGTDKCAVSSESILGGQYCRKQTNQGLACKNEINSLNKNEKAVICVTFYIMVWVLENGSNSLQNCIKKKSRPCFEY